MSAISDSTARSLRRHLRLGLAVVVLLVAGVGGWAVATEVSGAVIAPGLVVVDSNVKKVQHPTGGIVGELNVRDGQKVKAGDVVLRLDETMTRANLAIITRSMDELMARRARLEAERDGTEAVAFPAELVGRGGIPEVAAIIAGERSLFQLRRESRLGQAQQLRQRIEQLKEEMRGQSAQEAAKAQEISFINRELDGARDLYNKNLMPITKLTQLEREATRLGGERGQIIAARAQSSGRIAEIELQILQISRDLASEVSRDLRDTEGKLGEFKERRVAAEDQLKRIELRAPLAGIVHQLAVHTVGGVIAAGDAVMLIVPATDELSIEARVAPHEIDQVQLGQRVALRFSTFNQRTTPELFGDVRRIAADISTDPRSGAPYYTVRVGIAESELARLDGARLVPGMPVEVFLQTEARTVLSYFWKPVQDQLSRAFRNR